MTRNSQPRGEELSVGKSYARCARGLSLIATLLVSSTALAGWNDQPETIATHPTWIYTPNNTLKGSNKRGLMVVLHGCSQTHNQIKNGGNLEKAAEEYGLIMAVPYVTKADGYLLDCWDFDKQLADDHGHMKEIIDLTNDLKLPTRKMNIDANHVYVVGLSSGGALALKAGCKAPNVFAGVGAIAGPSVGSNQLNATVDRTAIPETNVRNAIETCKSLAGNNSSALQTQITNIAYGDMDKNGPRQIDEIPPCQQQHPGQNCVASIKWSEDNIEILRDIYHASELGPKTAVQDGQATAQSAKVGDHTALSLLVMHEVGHALGAGSGGSNDPDNPYIARKGPNYSEYVSKWFVENNRRSQPDGPVVTCNEPSVSGKSVSFMCSASGPNPISSYHVVVSGPSAHDDSLPGGGSFSKQYDNMASGNYTVRVNATDDQGKDSMAVTKDFVVNGTKCFTASNSTHVAEARAYGCGFFGMRDCAKGSDDSLGWWFNTTSLKQTKPDYWMAVSDCK